MTEREKLIKSIREEEKKNKSKKSLSKQSEKDSKKDPILEWLDKQNVSYDPTKISFLEID